MIHHSLFLLKDIIEVIKLVDLCFIVLLIIIVVHHRPEFARIQVLSLCLSVEIKLGPLDAREFATVDELVRDLMAEYRDEEVIDTGDRTTQRCIDFLLPVPEFILPTHKVMQVVPRRLHYVLRDGIEDAELDHGHVVDALAAYEDKCEQREWRRGCTQKGETYHASC